MEKRKLLTLVFALFTSAVGFCQIHITTVAELQAIQSDNSYILDADLDLAALANGLEVGDLTDVTLDGNFHTLSNLVYDGGERGGLFGNLSGCTVRNLKVENFVIAGTWAGAIAGHANNSTFYACSSENGEIESSGIGGGIVGHISATAVSECFATGIVNGNDHVGGLVGHMDSGSSIADCYTLSDVATASWQVGGIVGWGENAGNTVNNCFAAGTVSAGQGFTGGIVGATSGGDKSYVTITNCIALQSELTADSDIIKTNRIVGDDGAATFSNNYGLATMTWSDPHRTDAWTSQLDGKDGLDITLEEIRDAAFYATNLPSWDFTNVWVLGAEYPSLKMESGSTGFSTSLLENIKIAALNGIVNISCPPNSHINIYNIAGQLIESKLSKSAIETFTAKGILIIKVETLKTKQIYKIIN
jgi:hypothetical protein